MVFINTVDLSCGMCLARDVNFYEPVKKVAISLHRLDKLNDNTILQLKNACVKGVYIDNIHSDVKIVSTINKEIKNEALTGMHNLADNFINSDKGIQQTDVDDICNTTIKLIDNLSSKNDILVNINDIKQYDDYTFHHSLSVSIMSIALAMELGMSNKEVFEIGLAGLLHDIGKLSVPKEILNKPGRLTDEEFEVMKLHPVYAAKQLKERHLVSEDCCAGVLQHHEKYNGTGYPYGLKGEEIHKYARVLCIADVYDALTSKRPYRNPSSPNEVLEYIMGGSATHFDVEYVKAFMRKIAPYPVGSKITLSNGHIATVLKNYPEQPLRPLISDSQNGAVYDLYKDEKYLNIVILALNEETKENSTIDIGQLVKK